ncbi:hypothetical protein FXF51_31555 [Nonomuraea sp. PA05]|uniref:hypothetical protein n=1 Tax=Nonomuraea sp. PA05 TaxID=2604466 RepID=UPI0011D90D26|nr:hypothetical protein [Nonomuraea sp. PA05]TYB60149.1 hypothetical protein FXF51_31555 [Nonomuraea sp. PA05]
MHKVVKSCSTVLVLLAAATGTLIAAPAAAGAETLCQGFTTSTSFQTRCESDWVWEGFYYRAWIRCVDSGGLVGAKRVGPTRHSFSDPAWSGVECPAGQRRHQSGRDQS